MMECKRQYGIEIFDIQDDNFTNNVERTKRLMRLIIETFGEGHLELSAMNGISFASLDEELLKLMKKAGFKTINLSYVSTNPSTRERIRRPKTTTQFDQILGETERIGLNVIAYAILGMPGQTIEEMVDTLIYLMGKKVLIGPSVYYPTPGTSLLRDVKKRESFLLTLSSGGQAPSLLRRRTLIVSISRPSFAWQGQSILSKARWMRES